MRTGSDSDDFWKNGYHSLGYVKNGSFPVGFWKIGNRSLDCAKI